MLLTVTDTAEELEKLRLMFSKSHYFTYCATKDKLYSAAKRYKPNVILLETDVVDDTLLSDMERVREILPDVFLLTVSNVDTEALVPVFAYPKGVYSSTVLRQVVICEPLHRCSSLPRESMILHGLHMDLNAGEEFLYGLPLGLTHNEAFLLRYLFEIYPRRATAAELGRLCFGVGVKAGRSTVASRISRINAKAMALPLHIPIISSRTNEGYQIEF
ncbi:MAG: hypothetical protein J6R89_06140 [Clostridia bacterium]|nr:hypothetical protein [Clostridia bacterium]